MFTILGTAGFIGSHLAARLRGAGAEVFAPGREAEASLGSELGHVIDCAGVTSDFRARPLDAVEAHVARLLPLLRRGRFDSYLYLSSTRVYRGLERGSEDAALLVQPASPDDLYNLSKLAGEAACLAAGRAATRVVRLSNVYGAGMPRDNFLAAVVADAVERGELRLATALDSCKDYLALEDALDMLPRIAREGRQRIYNLASGRNVSHGELAEALARLTGCRVAVAPEASRSTFPPIGIERASREFGFRPRRLEAELPALVEAMRERTVAA